MKYVIQILGAAGQPTDPRMEGFYIQEFDHEAHDGLGSCVGTRDPSRALAFDSVIEALEFIRRQSTTRPLRPDGLPNRPLTGTSNVVVPLGR